MNAKKSNLIIVVAVALLMLATSASAHFQYQNAPAGVPSPRPHVHGHHAAEVQQGQSFDLLGGIGKLAASLLNGAGNALDALWPDEKPKTVAKPHSRTNTWPYRGPDDLASSPGK